VVQILIAFVIGAGLGFGIGRVIPRRTPAIPSPEVSPSAPAPPPPAAELEPAETAEEEEEVITVVAESEPDSGSEGIDQRMGGVLAELERRYEGRRAEAEEAAARPAPRRPRRKPAK
jgi:hypothetical protein